MTGAFVAVTPGPVFRWAVQQLLDAGRRWWVLGRRALAVRERLDYLLWLLGGELDTGWWCSTQRPKRRYRYGSNGPVFVYRWRGPRGWDRFYLDTREVRHG